MSIWLVVDENSMVRKKTEDEMAARTYALAKGWEAISFKPGQMVDVMVCKKCRTHIRNGVCPNMCHEQDEK